MSIGLSLDLLRKDGIQPRGYQLLVAENVLLQGNTLVVMPTALGKTFIAVLLIAHFLKASEKKALFLAPTKPLVMQQAVKCRELLDLPEDAVGVVTGEVNPSEREALWKQSKLIVGTPQTVSHDVLTGKLSLTEFALVVFDEAHKAVGDYAYVFLGKQAQKHSNVRVLGLTASPSSEREKVDEICGNLGIENVEVRSDKDADVKEFVKKVELDWVFVELPKEVKQVRGLLSQILFESLKQLRDANYLQSADVARVNKRDLLAARVKILVDLKRVSGAYQAMSVLAKAINLTHAIDLLESQGIDALHTFIQSMRERPDKTKAVTSLLNDYRLAETEAKCLELMKAGFVYPKMLKLKDLIADAAGKKESVIVFAHYKDSVHKIVGELNALSGVQAREFVGRSGMTQKKQEQVLQAFRDKEFNVLCSTSVGEEGLDVPAVDLVIFYEAVPSEIRLIQRRGRAGRVRAGKTMVLLAQDTKDEAFFWISRKKEKKMNEMLRVLSLDLKAKKKLEVEEGHAASAADARAGVKNNSGQTNSVGQRTLGDF